MHRRRYVHYVGLRFIKHDFNTLTSAQNLHIYRKPEHVIYTVKLSVMLQAKKT